ncbi:MAG: hypothetical protein KA436_06765 [Oligoflexales bacterium]|nr:hypothetical protein [Oligoflexales bacterium]
MLLRTLLTLLLISFSSVLKADETKDFEDYVDNAISNIWTFVRDSASTEREQIAPTQIEHGIKDGIALGQLDIKAFVERYKMASGHMEKLTTSLNSSIHTIETTLRDSPYSLRSFETLISEKSKLEELTVDFMNEGRVLESFHDAVKAYDKDTLNFCSKLIPTLNIHQLSLSPITSKETLRHKETYPDNFMNEDPVAKSFAIVTGSTLLVAGIFLYASMNGVSAGAAATSMFSVSGGTGMGVSITASGPGIVILIAAATGAYIVGRELAFHENRQRKKKAKKAFDKLFQETQRAQQWFKDHRINNEEYRLLAKPICEAHEKELHPSLKKPGAIFDFRQFVRQFKADLGSVVSLLHKQKEILEKNLETIHKKVSGYQTLLSQYFSKDLIRSHTKRIYSQRKTAAGWAYYNKYIKTEWLRFSEQSQDQESCDYLDLLAFSSVSKLEEEKTYLFEKTRDELNQNDDFFSQIEHLVMGIQRRILKSKDLCSEEAPEEDDDDDFPLPLFSL